MTTDKDLLWAGRKLARLAIGLGLVLLAAACASPSPSPAGPTPTIDRLAPPPTVQNPSQADLGAQVYNQVCMACHGDRGQGLTDEWRAVWGDDGDCWQSGCHGPDHPPEGFSHPRYHPAILGPGTMARFKNALELHDYIAEKMPWWKPGYLKPDEYWQLTAYLLRARNALPEGVVLTADNAGAFPVTLASPPPKNPLGSVLFIAILLLAIAGLIAIDHRRKATDLNKPSADDEQPVLPDR